MSVPVDPNLLEENDDGEAHGVTKTMEPELYKATVGGDILEFVMAMENWAVNRHHCLSALCVPLGPQKNTVLHLATSCGHHEIVKLLCKDLPDLIAEKDARGDTALHIAARAGDGMLILLLTGSDYAGCVLGETNDAGNTPLHEALQYHHEDVARILVQKNRNLSYSVNREGKSVMYLAAEAGYAAITRLLVENPVGYCNVSEKDKDKSPLIAAIRGRNIEVLKLLWWKDHSSFIKRNKGRNPLHYAACTGFTEGAEFLLEQFYSFAYWTDKQGLFPIHVAAIQGHVEIIRMMLQLRPDSGELLTPQRQNILHLAAKCGKVKAFDAMVMLPELEKLLNARDDDGNTPLHVATIYGHPKVVSTLMWDNRVNLKVENNEGLTAHDIAEEQMKPEMLSFRKHMTWMALRLVDTPRAPNTIFNKTMHPIIGNHSKNTENFRDKVNVILLVATLVATVTFTAGFTVPGGTNNSDPDQGIANMLEKVKFQAFVICDSLAMYISIIVAVILLWAQLADQKSMYVALKLALPLLGIALAMMSIAFMAGMYLVVSKLGWLAKLVLLLGSHFVVVLGLLFLPLCFLGSSNYRMLRFISYYPFSLMLYALGNYAENEAEE
ncbi:OLC1v1023997C1 [Oldenlandia corymbosa var. corymbosa]|uniref:OLC1v1023997C1 n=1 Tax=Oldenlandia corymbosa var. corymbosa TaxID=529605 RepID=A0AAV1C1H4_OLDCO|nr:OLC1v1023997C1 [Oldenlandia corymbosa var. corymbosa]